MHNIRTLGLLIILMLSPLSLSSREDFSFTVGFLGELLMEIDPLTSSDSFDAQVSTALHEGLLVYDPRTLALRPGAALSWEVSDNKRHYTFHLRTGLRYSNGESLTAHSFRRSWLRLISPERVAPFASFLDAIQGVPAYRKGQLSSEKVGILVLSPTRLLVTLSRPIPYFLKMLCHHSLGPSHPTLATAKRWSQDLPFNGPYRFVKEEKAEDTRTLVLERNPHYWDRANVSIPTVKILLGKRSPERVTEDFNHNRLHWVTSSFDPLKIAERRTIVLNPAFATTFFFFSGKEAVWRIPAIRRGLALLIPWEILRKSSSFPAKTLVPPLPHYPEVRALNDQNIDEGLRLLAEGGYPRGKGLPPLLLLLPSVEGWSTSSLPPPPQATLIKEAWESLLSTTVEIMSVPFAEYELTLRHTPYTLGMMSWVGDYADPMAFLQLWLTDDSLNLARYADSQYDRLIRDSSTRSFLERYRLMSQAESRLLSSAQVLPISHLPAINLIDLRVIEGWYPNVLDIHPFKDLRFRKTPIPLTGPSWVSGTSSSIRKKF